MQSLRQTGKHSRALKRHPKVDGQPASAASTNSFGTRSFFNEMINPPQEDQGGMLHLGARDNVNAVHPTEDSSGEFRAERVPHAVFDLRRRAVFPRRTLY